MYMKKFILICFSVFAAVNIYAQSDSEKMGDTAFSMGNYADAIQLYDGAIILSKDRKDEITIKRSKASTCNFLKKRGESLYASKEYEEARAKYLQLKSLNPADKSVNAALARLDKRIAEAKSQAAQAEKQARIENAYYEALKCDVAALEKFCDNYPTAEQIVRAKLIIDILEQEQYDYKAEETSLYNSIGKDFEKIGNADMSQKMFDHSASLADPEGLYLKAMTYNYGTKAYITLMAMSASSGYEPAIERLDGVKHNDIIAKIYYNHLKEYRNNLLSAIFLKENRHTYYLDFIEPDKYIKGDEIISYDLQELRDHNINGNLAYYIANILKDDDRYVDASVAMLYYSASSGNADASYQLAKMVSLDKKPNHEMIDALYLCAINGGVIIPEKSWNSSDVRNYISFMKNGKADDAWSLFLASEHPYVHLGTGVIDKHEALLNCCHMVKLSYHYKYFKQFLRKHYYETWDKAYIERVINYLSEKDDTYSKKILKKVSKLTLEDGQYTSELAEFIQDGFVDNQYRYSSPVIKCDVLWDKDNYIGENGIRTH